MMETEVIAPSWGLWFGIALGFALWAAGIAGSKQRSMLLFGALGFAFGLIGVLIAYEAAPPAPPRASYTPFAYPKKARRGATPASSR